MTSTVSTRAGWADRACADVDLELFFPTGGGTQGHVAQRLCASCPVLARCAEIAQKLELRNCVVASVWMPSVHSKVDNIERAQRELAEVAATGKPAPLMPPLRAPKDNSQRWSDPQFQAQVNELREQGLGWERIAARLSCSESLVHKARKHIPTAPAGVKRIRRPRRAAATCGHPRAAAVPTVQVRVRKWASDFEFQKQVAQLRTGDERTWAEIGSTLGCSPQTARSAYTLLHAQVVAS